MYVTTGSFSFVLSTCLVISNEILSPGVRRGWEGEGEMYLCPRHFDCVTVAGGAGSEEVVGHDVGVSD